MADIIGDDTKMADLQTDPAGEDRRDVSDAGYEEGDDDVTSSGKSDSRRSISPEDDVERPVGSGLSNGAGEGATGGPDFDTGEESPLSEDGAVAAENDMPADAELSAILSRRCNINDALEEGRDLRVKNKIFNVYNEFNEFSIKEIKSFTDTFRKWDVDKDGFLDLTELKRMMEALGAPQTHLGLKQMISDGGNQEKEGAISFREFLYILRRARAGEFDESSGLNNMAKLTEVNVEEVGVGGAKSFFEAKIMEQTQASKFEAEIKADKEEKQRQAEEAKKRRAAFKNKANFFETGAPSPAI